MKHTLEDEKLKDKFNSSDKDTLTNKIREAESWLHANPEADTGAYEAKQKEL